MELAARQKLSVPPRITRRRSLAIAGCIALLAHGLPVVRHVSAATVIEPGFQVATIISGLGTPTAMAFAPDGRIFVAERDGMIKEFDSGKPLALRRM